MTYSDYAGRGTENVFRRNVVVWSKPAARIFDGQLKDSAHLDSDDNIYWHEGQPVPELAELQKRGFDRHSLVADPRFADPAKEDYRFRPDSPAVKLGFRPIDTSRVGPRRADGELMISCFGQRFLASRSGVQTASRTISSNCGCKSWFAEARNRPVASSICPPSGEVTTPPASRIKSTPAAMSQILVENPHKTPMRPAATSHILSDAEPVRVRPGNERGPY